MAGTAIVVPSATVVAFRYQVASRARAAKLGKRLRSTCPPAAVNDELANSSKTTTTSGVEFPPALAAVTSSWGSTSFETGEVSKKIATNTQGSGRERRQDRRPDACSGVRDGAQDADDERECDQDGGRPPHTVDHLDHERRQQQCHEDQMKETPSAVEGEQQRLQHHHQRRRDEGDGEGEHDDVAARVSTGNEEIRAVRKHVEERLGERQRPEHPRWSQARSNSPPSPRERLGAGAGS